MTDTILAEEGNENFHADWPRAYGWAIDQMPCPAYCCTPDGTIVRCNPSAERLWGWRPSASSPGLWHGFDALRTLDGKPVERAFDPAQLAASGANATDIELVATCRDGQTRRIVARAKVIVGLEGQAVGILCCLIDITERCRWEKEAREVLDGRSDFLTVLAHELRNPLSPIMSAAKILRRNGVDPMTSRMAETVERQARTLARFVSDLLDASRMDDPWQLPVQPRACIVSDVLERATDNVQAEMRLRRQNLSIEASDAGAPLFCDPKRVAQAIGNVLANASKFTPDGGEIRLTMAIEGQFLLIEVVDQGPGIAVERLDSLFMPFARHAAAPGRAPSGAGVGLAIAKNVCDAHGGTLTACNHVAGGARLVFSLPVVAAEWPGDACDATG